MPPASAVGSVGTMRFSVWPTTSQKLDDFMEVAGHAAGSGWDGIWVADHFMSAAEPVDTPMLECFTTLAALAVNVPRVRIGSLVAGNTYRHPAVLANMAATVDQLSGGRLVLGLGAGWQHNEHQAYGIDLPGVPERLARLEEACAVVRQLFDRPRGDFAGRYYQLTDAPMEPKAARAHLPLLIGGGGERITLGIVARWADEWNTWGTPDVLAAKGAVLDRHCQQAGRDPSTISRSAQVLVDLDGHGEQWRRPMPMVRGGVAELQELLGGYVDAGVDELIVPDWNLGTGTRRRDALDRFLDEVAAPFRPAPPPSDRSKRGRST